ncbi:Mitochondrial inner membrane protease subunit 1-like protein [Leptotrombidium deliense]|uniref:Mitochondrial inner membrane protease subunit 1-like protein n=1 Tax=Leptotrombidium deliense TaxID=299467 RepID=A0A443SFK1_9ACAR|nr:Mitochondrial inner membrane protease subunit 1-like protein [Leptotrombidium deliense]
MEPAIRNNDILLSSQWAIVRKNYGSDNCFRGNIVIARSPDDPNSLICKRIVAVEGDTIRFGFSIITVPKGHVWLEGDNKDQSKDSREYGSVPSGLITGKVIYRVHPFENASKIE